MPMKILIIEENAEFAGACSDALRTQFPGVRIDMAVSVGRYVNDFADTEYDACIMSDRVYGGKSAFSETAPQLKKKFPKTVILCNSSLKSAEDAEKRAGMELFARGQDSGIIPFNRQVWAILEYLCTRMVPKDERKPMPAPKRISVAPAEEPQRRRSVPPR
ncbi:MAG: hypothetical protein WC350_00915 [Candidatus Micrarchaeia archaeon]